MGDIAAMTHPTDLPRFPRRRVLAGGALAVAATLLPRAGRAATGLRVADQKGGLQSVMKAAGVLDGMPYPVHFSQFPAAAPVLEALNADAVDIAYAGDAPTIVALAGGMQSRIVSVIRNTGHGTAVIVPPGSVIADGAGLKGKRIAANRGSIAHALLLSLAEAKGWPVGAYTQANLLPAESKAALAAGAVDAWSSWGVYIAQAKLTEGARAVVDAAGLMPSQSYVLASTAAIAGKRAVLEDFCRRLIVARRWALAHRDLYAAALAVDIGVSTPVARLVLDTDDSQPVPIDAAAIEGQQHFADLYLRAGLIESKLDAGAGFDASFNAALSG